MLSIVRVRGFPRPCRGRSDIWKAPAVWLGLFRVLVGLELADAVAEFVG